MLRTRRYFSLYSKPLYEQALSLLEKNEITLSKEKFLLLKQDKSIYKNPADIIKLNNYLKICYITKNDHLQITKILEEQMFLYKKKKPNEEILLKDIKNLIKGYIETENYEKAWFFLENFETILKKKNFSNYFNRNLLATKSTVHLFFHNYREVKQICYEIINNENSDDKSKSIAYNNLALAYLFGKKEPSKEEVYENLKKSLLMNELNNLKFRGKKFEEEKKKEEEAKKNLVVFEKEEENVVKEREALDIKKEDFFSKIDFEKNIAEDFYKELYEILEKEKFEEKKIEKIKLSDENSLIICGNISEYFFFKEKLNENLFFNKLGFENCKRIKGHKNYTRFCFNIFSYYKKIGNINLAENFLIKSFQYSHVLKSEYLKFCFLEYFFFLKNLGRFFELEKLSQKFYKVFLYEEKEELFFMGRLEDFKIKGFVDHMKIRKEYLILDKYEIN